MPTYKAVIGLNYQPEGKALEAGEEGTRVEAGEEVPASVIKRAPWLLEQGYVIEGGAEGEGGRAAARRSARGGR